MNYMLPSWPMQECLYLTIQNDPAVFLSRFKGPKNEHVYVHHAKSLSPHSHSTTFPMVFSSTTSLPIPIILHDTLLHHLAPHSHNILEDVVLHRLTAHPTKFTDIGTDILCLEHQYNTMVQYDPTMTDKIST